MTLAVRKPGTLGRPQMSTRLSLLVELASLLSREVDLDALLRTVEAFGRLAAAATGIISEIEINPLLIGPDGAVAVDCLTTLSGYASHAQ